MMDQRILVVDDAKLARKMLRRALNDGGLDNIDEAVTAMEAMEKFKTLMPDLVLLDITLPDSFDLTLLENLLKEKPDANIIMVSAIGQDLIIQDAIELGAKAFITKPFEEKELLKTVFKVLEA